MTKRISKFGMFLEMAQTVSQRSTCGRSHVGAIITDQRGTNVVAIGYNGNARGMPNKCDSSTPGECGCVHAEANALIKAPYQQGPLTLFTTMSPCVDCAKLIVNSAVTTVWYEFAYRDHSGLFLLRMVGLHAEPLHDIDRSEEIT